MLSRRGPRVALVVAALAASCTFPDYITPDQTTASSASTASAGGASSSDSSSSADGSSTSGDVASSTASAGGGGGAGGASSTSAMASSSSGSVGVCSAPCDTSSGAKCSAECTGASMDPSCDCDGDGEIIDTAGCKSAHPGAPIDCYDCNADAKHGQTGWFVDDRGDGDYDFNCTNLEEPRYTTACGEGLLACTQPYRYDMTPGCGNNGNLFACNAIAGILACTKAMVSNVAPQACH